MAWRGRATIAAIVAVVVALGVLILVRRTASRAQPAPTTTSPAAPPKTAPPKISPAAPGESSTAEPDWVGTWAVAMEKGTAGFDDQTLRQVVRTSIGGTSVRLRISDVFGTGPVTVGTARVARHTSGSRIDTGTDRAVTFGGSGSVTVAAGGSVTSDPVEFAVPAIGDLAVSLYLPSATGPATRHGLANRNNYVGRGDQTGAARLTGATTTSSYYFLTGVDVLNPAATGAVVTLGASLTDGLASSFGGHQRWPDLLARRLHADGRAVGVLNAGISGNQLIEDGTGESARSRFDRDVLAQPGARWVIFSDNPLNDLGGDDPPSADDLIGAMQELIARGHAAGLKFLCSTLTPFAGAGYWTRRGETGRDAINSFVRGAASGCDGVLDQDAALRDPSAPSRLRDRYDSGDHLHPNDAGMQAIADALDLRLLS